MICQTTRSNPTVTLFPSPTRWPSFVARLEPPLALSTYFADPDLVSAKIAIQDFTDSVSIADELGQIIEMLGGKVFAVYDKPTTQEDCTIVTTSAHRSEEHTSELQSLMRISNAVFCLKQKKLN